MKIVNGKETLIGVPETDFKKLLGEVDALRERVAVLMKNGDGVAVPSVENSGHAHFDAEEKGYICDVPNCKKSETMLFGKREIRNHLKNFHKIEEPKIVD